jgi:hypothetical protein
MIKTDLKLNIGAPIPISKILKDTDFKITNSMWLSPPQYKSRV